MNQRLGTDALDLTESSGRVRSSHSNRGLRSIGHDPSAALVPGQFTDGATGGEAPTHMRRSQEVIESSDKVLR